MERNKFAQEINRQYHCSVKNEQQTTRYKNKQARRITWIAFGY